MNQINCENLTCKYEVYIQPPSGILQKKCERYVHSDVPMQYESEQKLSYIKHPTPNCEQLVNSSVKKKNLGECLKFGVQQPVETTHHFSYKKWRTPNKVVIKRPKDCTDLLGSGPLNLITTQQIEFQRKTLNNQPCKECV